MRAAISVAAAALIALSCGQANPTALTTPAPTPSQTTVPTPSPTPTAPTETIEQLVARCPTAAELASVDSSVSMTFTSDPSAGTLVCTATHGSRDLTLLQERAYQAVLMFTWIRFDAPLPWTNLPLDAWFAQAIHGVAFNSDIQYSYCCLPGGIIDIQTNNLAVLTSSVAPSDAVRWLAALFIHEARHHEGYPHTCGSNDNTIAELGAWGVQYYFNLWLGMHSDPAVVPESDRLSARLDAVDMRRVSFCKESPSPSP